MGNHPGYELRLLIQYAEPSVEFSAPTVIRPNGPELSWGEYVDPSPDDGDDLVEFQVYRQCVSLPDGTCTSPAPIGFDGSPSSGATLIGTIPKDVRTFTDTTAKASTASATATYRYWVIARTKDGVRSPSASQTVQMARPGRVLRVLTGDISDTTIANATAYAGTNLPNPEGYNRVLPGNNHATYGDTRGLMEFDTAQIPTGVTVLGSELQLWKSAAPGAGATFDLHELAKDFVESEATWNSAASTIPWATKGGDFGAVLASSSTVPSSPSRMTWKGLAAPEADPDKRDLLTKAVQRWVNKFDDNHGLLIKTRDESLSQQRLAVAAGEFSEPALRPRLVVEYVEKSTAGTYYAPEIPDRVVPNTTLTVPVTVTNTTKSDWTNLWLTYRWMAGGVDAADEGDRLLSYVGDLAPGESKVIENMQIRVPIQSQNGNKRQNYDLEVEVRNADKVWGSDPASGIGIAALKQPIIVEDPTSGELGLEKFFTYSGENTGAGSSVTANARGQRCVHLCPDPEPVAGRCDIRAPHVRQRRGNVDGCWSGLVSSGLHAQPSWPCLADVQPQQDRQYVPEGRHPDRW